MRRLKIFSFLSLLIYLFSQVNKDDFLGSFAKFRKETIGFVMLLCNFRMKQLGSH